MTFWTEVEDGSTYLSLIRNQRVSLPAVPALSLRRVTVDEKTAKHRVVQTANFVFNEKDRTTIIGVDNFFKAILVIADIFRNQATALQVAVGSGKIGHIDGDMVSVVGCLAALWFPERPMTDCGRFVTRPTVPCSLDSVVDGAPNT